MARVVPLSRLHRGAAALGSSVVVVTFAALVYLGLQQQGRMRAEVAHTHQVIEHTEQVLARLVDAETGQRGFLLTGRADYLDPYVAAEHDVFTDIAGLRDVTRGDPGLERQLDSLAALVRTKFSELDTTIALERTEGHAAALAMVESGRGKRTMEAVRLIAGQIEATETQILAQRQRHERRTATITRGVLVGGTLFAVVVAALLNAMLARHAAAQAEFARVLDERNAKLRQQTVDLEGKNEQLQAQTLELELQQQQMQEQAAELEAQTEELEATNEELERATARLEHEGERLRLALDAGELGTWEWNIADGTVNWSPTVERMHGVDAGTFPGTFDAFQRDIHPADRDSVLGAIRAAVEARAPHHIVYRIIRRDGGTRWVEAFGRPVVDRAGRVTRLVGVCGDVTDRKHANDRLQFIAGASATLASSLDYESTLATVAQLAVPMVADWCAVDIVRDDGTLKRVAIAHPDAARRALVQSLAAQYPDDPAAAHGRYHVLRTGTPELVPHVPDELLVTIARDAEHLQLIRQLGFVSYMIVPLIARGSVLGVMSFVSSESQRQFTERDLALAEELARRAAVAMDNARLLAASESDRRDADAARQAAEDANRAKSEFLATMSHELRTPLNAIAGYVELMEMEIRGPITTQQRDDLERIRENGRHLLALINDILNFAKLEAGHVELRVSEIAAHDLLASLEPLVAPQLGAHRLTYHRAPCDPALTVCADPEKVRQILLNVLTNAIKFTPAGGHVEVQCDHDGAAVRVRITDTGRGIAPDQLERIFEPFVQVDRHLTGTSQQGVGLGLAISRDLARRMGGELTASSTVGAGSTFTLVLPRGPARAAASPASAVEAVGAAPASDRAPHRADAARDERSAPR